MANTKSSSNNIVERIENCATAQGRENPDSIQRHQAPTLPYLDWHDYQGWAHVPGSTALDVSSTVVKGSLGFGL